MILRKVKVAYDLGKGNGQINYLLFMDDIKVYAKNKKGLESLVRTIHVFSNDVGMEFGIEKCATLKMKRGRSKRSQEIEMLNGQTMGAVEKGQWYKYLGILEADEIKNEETKQITSREHTRRGRKLLQSKLNSKSLIESHKLKSSTLIQIWSWNYKLDQINIKELDRKTRKLLTMYGAHHPKADINRLSLRRDQAGRGLIVIEECVQIGRKSLVEYL
ncbi:uncharacterized protein LOC115217830 [Octopus sinensis]|uniref:Uncharacterized protein LOC115217830 n=1 Tax=Octopus sinensis TaxID=2607531 RepID=A0A6P7SY95_9MOLL|nr:uncharacterized protein LOC115217830 [Octopus sinensis]